MITTTLDRRSPPDARLAGPPRGRRRGRRSLGLVVALLAGIAGCGDTETDARGGAVRGDDPAAGEAEARRPPLGPHDGHDLPGVDRDRVRVGDTAPDFTLRSYDEGVLTLSDFRGEKNIILVFYRGHW